MRRATSKDIVDALFSIYWKNRSQGPSSLRLWQKRVFAGNVRLFVDGGLLWVLGKLEDGSLCQCELETWLLLKGPHGG